MNLHLSDSGRTPEILFKWAAAGVSAKNLTLRLLLSYWYYKDVDLDVLFQKFFHPPYPEVFADSGAFSAKTQGKSVDLSAYCVWVNKWRHLITTYANLDVIGNAQASLENQKEMEKQGLSPIPVFHTGEPWNFLDSYIEQYPYIGLGGMVPYMREAEKVIPWLVSCFKRAKGKSVFHGFGCTSWRVISVLPWYSVDSSSWGQGFRYGQVPLFDWSRGRFVDAQLGDAKTCYKHARLFRELGFDPAYFADREKNDRSLICAISAISYLVAEQWLTKRFGKIGIPRRDGSPLGMRMHLVDTRSGLSDSAVPHNLLVKGEIPLDGKPVGKAGKRATAYNFK